MPRRVFAGIALAFAVLLANAALAYRNTLVLRDLDRQTEHSYDALNELKATLVDVTDAESAVRGYVITYDPAYLKRYQQARADCPERFGRLMHWFDDNPPQLEKLTAFRTTIERKFERLELAVAIRPRGIEAVLREAQPHRGRDLMDQVRALAADIQQDEQQRLAQRIDREAEATTTLIGTVLVTTVLAAGLLFIVGFLHRAEVRQRQQAADTLFREHEQLRVTLDSIGDAVIVTDPAGNVTFINPVAVDLAACPAAQAIGRPLTDLFHLVDEDTQQTAEDRAQQVLRMGEAGGARAALLVRPNGYCRQVDESAAPIRGRDGRVAGVVLVYRDVTERRRTQRQLEERLADIEALMDVMPAAVWRAHDASCRRITGNRVADELLGLPRGSNASVEPGEGEAFPVRMFRRGAPLAPGDLPMQQATATGQPVRGVEIEARLPDGTVRALFGSATPLFDDAGAVRGGVAAFLDITERKRLEEELQLRVAQLAETDRRKDEFLAMLAHELRNPLAPILTSLEVLRRGDQPFAGPMGEMLERQVMHVVRLVDDLLDVARINRGKIELRRQPVDLAAAARHAVDAAQPLLAERPHDLEFAGPPAPLWVDADPARVDQVLANLLSNAIKYTPTGGRIRLSVEAADGQAVFRVADDGIGIRGEMLGQIFELFQQGDRVPGRVSEGLGIGLTLVQRLVQMHGGAVEAHSPGPGLGSTFVVRLPLAAAPAAPVAEERKGPPERRPLHVLVCDDNVDAAVSLAAFLRITGHTTVTTHDGPAALAAVHHGGVDAALLDIGLPRGMDGYELARRIRAEYRERPLFLVALTGYGQEEDRQRALAAGFDVHLVKPAPPETILELLGSLSAPPVSR